MTTPGDNVVRLQQRPGGPAGGMTCARMRVGRYEVTTAGFDPNLQLVGGDPWGTPDYTGLVVPAAATPLTRQDKRYLFLLARAQFNNGEKFRLRGLRQYLSIFGTFTDDGGNVQLFEHQVTSPMFRFPDGNVSWHVMLLDKLWRDRRNPNNADSVMFQDAYSPALLYQVPTTAGYIAPNGGRPWGKTPTSDLGNIHDLRYPWRDSQVEIELDIPIPSPCDVAVFASVAQTNPSNHPDFSGLSAGQLASLESDWQFYTQFSASCVYGRVAASLIFEEEEQA
jgi:hypothetical protein